MLIDSSINFLEKNVPFYNKLNKQEIDMFNSNAFMTTFKKNHLIRVSKHECSGLIIIFNGCLRAYLNSSEGKEITLYKLLKYDTCIFTASCVFNNINFNMDVEAIEDTEVIILPSKYVEILSKQNMLFKEYLLQLTQSKMSEVMWIMEQVLFTSFDERLKNYLLDFNSDEIKITHSEIAKDLGTAREVVSRMLKHFENEGMISMSRGIIKIMNLS